VKYRRLLLALGLVLVLGAALALLEPNGALLGWLRGEAFFRGRPASGWARRLRDADPAEQERAVSALREGKGSAVPVLLVLLRGGEEGVSCHAALTLGGIGPEARGSVPALVSALDEGGPRARECAAQALGQIGLPDERAIAALRRALKAPEAAVRREAVKALGLLGPAANAARADVKALLADPEQEVRVAARNALLRIAPLRLVP
jgi:HEAT repeat protein